MKLYKVLLKDDYDSICDFTGDFAAFVLLIARFAGIKNRIVFYRGTAYQFSMTIMKWFYVKLLKLILKISAPKILSNSKYALDVFHPGWAKSKQTNFKVIFNGVPYSPVPKSFSAKTLKAELKISEGCFVIGHVGSFRKAKNHLTIINIAKELVKKSSNLRFLLIGHGVSEGLTEQLKKEKLADIFIMPGNRKDIPELLSVMDVFLFPSTDEGQPNALIEAMLFEIPLFASNIPGIMECTPPEVYKNLFQPEDYISYTDAIQAYYETGNTYDVKKVGDWAKKEFNPQVRFKEFLNELI